MKAILDSSILIDISKGRTHELDYYLRSAESLLLSPVVEAELASGFELIGQLKQGREFFARLLESPKIERIIIDSTTAHLYSKVYKELRTKGTPIPTNDIWIAASSFQHAATLFTKDPHFKNVSGILFEII